MATVIMSLGDHIFYVPVPDQETPGFDLLGFDSQFGWASQARLGRRPAKQFTGPGEEHVSISGRLYPNHFGGIATLNGIRESAAKGEQLKLIRFHPLQEPKGMAGVVVGLYGIDRIRVDEQKIGANGVAHRIDFTLELSDVGQDEEGTEFVQSFDTDKDTASGVQTAAVTTGSTINLMDSI